LVVAHQEANSFIASGFSTTFSKARSAVEHAVAKVKTWRILSCEGGRCRCPIDKFESESMLVAVAGLYFFALYGNEQ
jgi:hypothetical protein